MLFHLKLAWCLLKDRSSYLLRLHRKKSNAFRIGSISCRKNKTNIGRGLSKLRTKLWNWTILKWKRLNMCSNNWKGRENRGKNCWKERRILSMRRMRCIRNDSSPVSRVWLSLRMRGNRKWRGVIKEDRKHINSKSEIWLIIINKLQRLESPIHNKSKRNCLTKHQS